MTGKSKDDIGKFNRDLETLSKTMEILSKNAPKEDYYRAIKKKYFKPKTNWAMLGVLVGIAGLIISVIIYLA